MKAKYNLNDIKEKWQCLQNTPNVFAYTLNVTQSKYLPGELQFYSELNAERSTLRRVPQTILSLDPPFDEEKFNFKKINPLEIISSIINAGTLISLIVNTSPLTPYHTLICPNVAAALPQRITPLALSFSVTFLRNLELHNNAEKLTFRIGYNSPGALASVNHLHLHLLQIKPDLYIDKAKLTPLVGNYIYRLSEDMPTEAICFVIYKTDSETQIQLTLQALYEYLMWLCEHNLPHNLFMTPSRKADTHESIKIFVYARQNFCIIKNLTSFNVGFCELAGYIPVGDKTIFNSLTEQHVIDKILNETGDVYKRIYTYFLK